MHAFEMASVLAAGAYFAFLAGEALLLKQARRSLRVVIHVNGTRGKTETTRLLAAALRACGLRTLAKTTGTVPRLLLEDGSERPWRRWGAPNVREQRDVLLTAWRHKAEALVVECMAVSPDAQAASTAFLKPDVLVVTNARPDHAAELGTPAEALTIFTQGALASAITITITADAAVHAELLKAAFPGRVLLAEPFLANGCGHPENAGVALAVTRWLGLPQDAALRGMAQHRRDPGAFALRRLPRREGGHILIADALSANDPHSTELLFAGVPAGPGPRVLLLANRADRADRALLFARWATSRPGRWDAILLTGDAVPGVRRILKGTPGLRALHRLEDLADEPAGTTVFAAGNWKTLGPALAALAPAVAP